jgi:hypothetical protein
MRYFYSNPSRESDPHALPNCETFHLSVTQLWKTTIFQAGWYWWSCFPGCLPDSEPCGPFATEQEAILDAQY